MGQIQLTISLVMIGLFTVAIIGFAVNFASDNSASISISDDPEITSLLTKTKQNISNFRGQAESTYNSIVKTNLESGTEVARNVGSFSITPGNAIGVVKNILEVSYTKIFGSDSGFGIFLTTLIAMLIFMIGLFLYKTLRGLPD